MANLNLLQTSFTGGVIDPRLVGRTELKAYADGAARLLNVEVGIGGGVRRRAGTRHMAEVDGRGRLAAVPLGAGVTRVFVLMDAKVAVFEGDVHVVTLEAPWTLAHLPRLSWAPSRGDLMVCHPQLPPQLVIREPYGAWRVRSWVFDTRPGDDVDRLVRLQPYAKYADPEASLEAVPGPDATWSFRSNQRVFDPGHVGTRLRFKGAEVALTSVAADRTTAVGIPQVSIDDPSRTFDWEEQAFSPVAGYPSACIMFRERLVVGGVPAMGNRLWMSKVGRPFDFDTGSGLDDEAIGFRLGDDSAHAIRAFSAGRELEVFTAASEWTVDGNPLAPASAFAVKQTGIGLFADRQVPPVSVDGASVFIGGAGDSVIEYVFTDIDTAYQAHDLAVRARHLLAAPVDLAFDPNRRLLVVVNGDGRMAVATLDRNAQMVAWAEHATDGAVIAAAAGDAKLYLLVERAGTTRLEVRDENLLLDAAVGLAHATPQTSWDGLTHLEGRTVSVLGDGHDLGDAVVENGTAEVASPVSAVVVGLAYASEIVPLAPLVDGRRRAELFRPISVTFQVHDTAQLRVDVGEGLRPIALTGDGAEGFTGTRSLRARGWRREGGAPIWRIAVDRPQSFHLLSVTSDVKVTR